ncbi:hypothetical protein DOY81_011207 [Sarcophaga bullata]|nr:hypothetical protein DOY81_011207 [Sarcophaga bullata]
MTIFTKYDASSIEPEFLTNVHDKFVRVINPNVVESKRYSARNRRSDREEIRRRLAMGAEENSNEPPQQQIQQQTERNIWKPSIQSRLQNDFTRITELSSDTESHSSDSETWRPITGDSSNISTATATSTATNDNQQLHPYHGRPLSVSISTSSNINNNNNNAPTLKQQNHQELQQQLTETFSNEDRECDFFTKQAKLQIEARMALSQAKEMAHMQMEIERQKTSVTHNSYNTSFSG